jgi:voltage-gated potassium channel
MSSRSVDAPRTPHQASRRAQAPAPAGLAALLSPREAAAARAAAEAELSLPTFEPRVDMSYLSRGGGDDGDAAGKGGAGAAAAGASVGAAVGASAGASAGGGGGGGGGGVASFRAQPVHFLGRAHDGLRDGLRAVGRAIESVTGKISRHFSLRRKLSIIMLGSPLGRVWDVFQVLMSLLSCFLYVASTYGYEKSIPFEIDWVITIFFTVDYALRFFIATNRLAYPFSFFAIVDLIACLPVYLDWADIGGNSSSLRFVRFLRVLRVLRIIRAFRMINVFSSPSSKALLTLGLTVTCIIFLGAGIFHVVETQEFATFAGGATDRDLYLEPSAPSQMSFLDACYYMVVTIFTVGYGDFFPITTVGRIVVIFVIVTSIVVFPILIEDVRTGLASMSAYRVSHSPEPEAPHVLVMGVCESAHPKVLMRDLLAEFFHHQRTSGLPSTFANALCVLLGNLEPPEQILELLGNPLLSGRIKYVRASAFRREDLMRAAISESSGVFLLCDASLTCGADTKRSDTEAALRAIMAKAHAPLVPTLMLVHDPQTALVMDTDDFAFHVASTFEWRANVLAGSALLPGFAGLMATLVRSSSAPSGRLANKKMGGVGAQQAEGGARLEPWQVDAATSQASRIAVGPIPDELDGISFNELARLVYDVTDGSATVIAVSELPALTSTSTGLARVADVQRRFAEKSLLAEDLLRSMAFLPQEAVIGETRAVQTSRSAAAVAAAAAAAAAKAARSATMPAAGAAEGEAEWEIAGAPSPTAADRRSSTSRSDSSFDLSTTSTAKARASTIEREVIMGKVLLNPGEAYRVRGGQIIFLVSATDEAAERAFTGRSFARAIARGMQLSEEDREAEEGYGYPAAWLAAHKAAIEMRHEVRSTQMLRRASLHAVSDALLASDRAKGKSAAEQAEAKKAAAAAVAPTRVAFAEAISSVSAIDHALRPIVCRDARMLSKPRAERHIILSCSVNEAAMMANAVRRRQVLDTEPTPLVLLLLRASELERCSLAQAHELLGIEHCLIVFGSADHAEALGRCAIEHARSIVLTLGGSLSHPGTEAGESSMGAASEGSLDDAAQLAASEAAEARRKAQLSAEAELAFQFSSVLRTLAKIRERRAKLDKERFMRRSASLASMVGTASAPSSGPSGPRRLPVVRPYAGPTVVLELRSMDDIFLLDTTATESMGQLKAAVEASRSDSRESSLRHLHAMSRSQRTLHTSLSVVGGPAEGAAPEATASAAAAATASAAAAGAAAVAASDGSAQKLPALRPDELRAASLGAAGFAASSARAAAAALSASRRPRLNARQRGEIEGATGSPVAFSSAVFSGGNLYANSLTYALLAGFYYCPLSSGVLSELLAPSISRGGSLVAAVDVPLRLNRRTYSELVEELRSRHDAVALGLYRFGIPLRDGHGAPSRYTLANPPANTVLHSGMDGCDSVFVLAHKHVDLAEEK